MRESVLSERVGNFRINVYYDECCENPRTEWDNASHFVTRSCYVTTEEDDIEGVISGLCERYGVDYKGLSFMEIIEALDESIVIKPISHYTHGGTTVFFGQPTCRWDSGICGFGYMEKEDLTPDLCKWNNYDINNWRKHCEDIMQGEMETFDRAVRGEVFGFVIEELDEPSEIMVTTPEYDEEWWEEDERNCHEYDSCFGYYMSAEEVMAEAKCQLPESKKRRVILAPVLPFEYEEAI